MVYLVAAFCKRPGSRQAEPGFLAKEFPKSTRFLGFIGENDDDLGPRRCWCGYETRPSHHKKRDPANQAGGVSHFGVRFNHCAWVSGPAFARRLP